MQAVIEHIFNLIIAIYLYFLQVQYNLYIYLYIYKSSDFREFCDVSFLKCFLNVLCVPCQSVDGKGLWSDVV